MYEIMYYAGMVLAVAFLIATIILFIRNKVWKLIGDVTGWNAKRAIRHLQRKGAEDTSKTEAIRPETSKVLVHKTTTTGTLQAVPESEHLQQVGKTRKKKQHNFRLHKEERTSLLQKEKTDRDSIFEVEEDVTVLAGAENPNRMPEAEAIDTYTTVLSSREAGEATEEEEVTTKLYCEEETEELSQDEQTDVLQSGEDEETTLLSCEGDEQTTLLTREEDEETTLLTREGDEETTLLAREGDEATTLLTSGKEEGSGVEAKLMQFEPVLQEDDELMRLLNAAVEKD
ncbi:MAG: hypothetical protein EGQ63_06870 [Clostridiales bacterium]|nr:hypothetical protein [Clostridiales bacterium]